MPTIPPVNNNLQNDQLLTYLLGSEQKSTAADHTPHTLFYLDGKTTSLMTVWTCMPRPFTHFRMIEVQLKRAYQLLL